MRKIAAVAALMVPLFGISARAQETPHVEIFGGGSYFVADTSTKDVSLRGWNVSVTENLNHWFGGTVDATGVYGNPGGTREFQHSIVGGPVFAYRKMSGVTPFAHLMIGGIRGSRGYIGISESATRFTGIFGGGLDLKVAKHLALRGQADYQVTPFFNQAQANLRFSAGVVLLWGKK